jgi:hypothetical protein
MKHLATLLLVLALPFTFASKAFSADFSGLWEGTCVSEGKTMPGLHLAIENTDLKITLVYMTISPTGPVVSSGMTYPLTKSYDFQSAGDDANGHWDLRSSYNWSWNVGRTEINISSRSILQGDRSKYEPVSSQTIGYIRLADGQLEIYQNTIANLKTPDVKSEIWCRYAKR